MLKKGRPGFCDWGGFLALARIEKLEGFGNAPFAHSYVALPDRGLGTPVMFMVDTGNSRTAIGERDVVKLGLDPYDLPAPKTSTLGVGGRGNVRVLGGPVVVSLVDTDNRFHEVRFENLSVLMNLRETLRIHGREKRIRFPYPALLGRDYLSELGCSLRFNFKTWDMWVEI